MVFFVDWNTTEVNAIPKGNLMQQNKSDGYY